MSDLFPTGAIPETLSPRLKWMRDNRIKTHHAPHMDCAPWMAIRLTEEHWEEDLSVGEAMAEECRLYDEAGQLAEEDTEDAAIVALAKKLGLPLWNEAPQKPEFQLLDPGDEVLPGDQWKDSRGHWRDVPGAGYTVAADSSPHRRPITP